ncbi:MAG: hypothetical protein ACTTH5_06700 [Wolinella sp.]
MANYEVLKRAKVLYVGDEEDMLRFSMMVLEYTWASSTSRAMALKHWRFWSTKV